jgi:hypothetical protein
MSAPGGDPGYLRHLSSPAWLAFVTSKSRQGHAPSPVRVADAESGAAKAETERKALLARIAAGKSKIAFDLSNRAVSPSRANEPSAREVVEKSGELVRQYTAYLDALSRTPAGFQLLKDLDKSKHTTTIVFDYKAGNRTSSENKHATDKQGEPATITLNPSLTTFPHREKETPAWTTEREKYSLYHELVHAWHITNGTQATGSHKATANSEWQATGLGPYEKDPITENAIRAQMSKAKRPDYSFVTY